mmetsp:Transcript_45895/g.121755  ORF Transcript_45895/g.121755 Transcript_45895/m.121755 type:complete len:342 (-) Transcript_45895:1126-2151(-)
MMEEVPADARDRTSHSTKEVHRSRTAQPFAAFFFLCCGADMASASVMPSGSMQRVKDRAAPGSSLSSRLSREAARRSRASSSASGPAAAAARSSSRSTVPLPSASSTCQASSFLAFRRSAWADPTSAPKSSVSTGSISALSSSPLPSASYLSKSWFSCSSGDVVSHASRPLFSTAIMRPGGSKEAWLTQLTGTRMPSAPSSAGLNVSMQDELMICPKACSMAFWDDRLASSLEAPAPSSAATMACSCCRFAFAMRCARPAPAAAHWESISAVGVNLQRIGSSVMAKPPSLSLSFTSTGASPLHPNEPKAKHCFFTEPARVEAPCLLPPCADFRMMPSASFI